MQFSVDILFSGFSGKLADCALGWGTWALIRNGKNNILLDTGGVGLRQNFDAILAKHQLTRAEIDYVLLTHLHFDHACNVDLLPNATFVLSAREWEFANSLVSRDYFIQESALTFLRSAKLHLIHNDGEEVIPGITALLTPGHTPGCISYLLHQPNGQLWVLAGDAAKNRGELRTHEVQMSLDPVNSVKSLKRLTTMADRVLPGHDGWVTIQKGKVCPEGGNDKELLFAQGVTVNGGQTKVRLHMD